ncbi:hypothetical protein HUJ04_003077 [Dendroctonus ponderosae]|nr:hypothetical protein HUJ04_003077 [Dendroctonus ponderosae]
MQINENSDNKFPSDFLQMTRRPSFNTFELKNLHVVISRRKSIECTKNDPLQRNIHDPAKISAHVHHRGPMTSGDRIAKIATVETDENDEILPIIDIEDQDPDQIPVPEVGSTDTQRPIEHVQFLPGARLTCPGKDIGINRMIRMK